MEIVGAPLLGSNHFVGWSYDQSVGPISYNYASSARNGTQMSYIVGTKLKIGKQFSFYLVKPYFFSTKATLDLSKFMQLKSYLGFDPN